MKDRQNQKLIESVGLIGKSDAMAEVAEAIIINRTEGANTLILGEYGCETETVEAALHPAETHWGRVNRVSGKRFPGALDFERYFQLILGGECPRSLPSIGLLEKSEGGAIIFEEINELSGNSQRALAQVLLTKSYARLGSKQLRSLGNVRVIATANSSSNQFKGQGRLETGFLRSWNGTTIHIPSLRERRKRFIRTRASAVFFTA